MTGSTIRSKGKRIAIGAAVAVFWLAVWQVLCLLVGQELLVPSPLSVLRVLWHNVQTLSFWQTVGISLLRILIGFAGAVVGGCVLAILTVRFSLLHTLLSPVLHIVKAAPVASFIILALIWMGSARLPLFIAFLMVFPVIYSNTLQGLKSTDPQLLEMARLFRVPWARRLRYIHLPALEPYLLAGCSTALGMSWKAGVAAEVIGVVGGSIGEKLYEAKIYLQTGDLLAWTAVIVALSALFERAVLALLRRCCRWAKGGRT